MAPLCTTLAFFIIASTSSHALMVPTPNGLRTNAHTLSTNSKTGLDKGPKLLSGSLFSTIPVAPDPTLLPTKKISSAQVPTKRSKWGVDKDFHEEYWFNKNIHTLGNVGFGGAVHAAMAPLATKMIDAFAYKGEDIRQTVAKELAELVHYNRARVLDLCCGVGMSTRALQKAFPDAEKVIGVDTSPEMISMASFLNRYTSFLHPESLNNYLSALNGSLQLQSRKAKKACRRARDTFMEGNAEHTPFARGSFDLVTIMFAFHEAPREGRARMIYEARRVLRRGGILALIDISPEYKPGASMLAGEPYVLEYQKNIQRQVRSVSGFARTIYKNLVPGHVSCWVLKRE